MTVNVNDILTVIEALAPQRLAEDWDNVGLQVGHPAWAVDRILVALDPTPAVVEEAIQVGARVLVTHHPLIFRPLRNLDLSTVGGALIQRLIAQQVAVIAAHTNLDSVSGGINDVLAERLALVNCTVLLPAADDAQAGLGRVGDLPQPLSLEALVRDFKRRMGLNIIRYAGRAAARIQRVAVCSGSGGSLVKEFLASEADVFVTGDVRYHDAREIEAHQRGVIDIEHFTSERIIVDHLVRHLSHWLAQQGLAADVRAAACEENPFKIL